MVEDQVVDLDMEQGGAYLSQLAAHGAEVTVAFWVRLVDGYDEPRLTLYVATPAGRAGDPTTSTPEGPGFDTARIPGMWFVPRYLRSNHPMAVEALQIRA